MDPETEELLKAEEAIQEVLKELGALKKQVGGYEAAKLSLESVRETLESFIEATEGLAEQTHAAVVALGKIGTPEILSRVEAVRSALAQRRQETSEQIKPVRTAASASMLVSILSLLLSVAILAKLFLH